MIAMLGQCAVVLYSLRLAGAQDLFLAAQPKASLKNASCIPDFSCAASNDASMCCSGKRYEVLEAHVTCKWGSQGVCDECKKIVGVLSKKLLGGIDCKQIAGEKICEDLGVTGELLLPLCGRVADKVCDRVQASIGQEIDALDVTVCEKSLKMCSGDADSKHYCGCLQAGDCVNPFTAAEQCCSGGFNFVHPFELCGMKHHNLPAPAKCT
eukprot:TRINITY_DN27407_c0_g2_i1.p1 TRINITY_DN27407_c0_g2~~TRINITY_DN27407_c0_g2_i1.p1  ORF type:complete len:210 (+),score=28.96 TRINITY_DN27407_c0_g2_i1:117-746(+)